MVAYKFANTYDVQVADEDWSLQNSLEPQWTTTDYIYVEFQYDMHYYLHIQVRMLH
jgi:hypothetical protein